MRKITLFSQIMLILCLTGFSLTVYGQSPWIDDFESYASGSWPSTWVADGNATNLSENYIDNSTAAQGSQSLRLFGVLGASWGALAYHPLSLSAPIEVEIFVKNGNETLSGAHPDRAYIGLRKGTSWSNPARMFILFKGDGTIVSGGGDVILGTYSTLTWYTVKIRYEKPTTSQVKLSYWINGVFKGNEILTAIADEDQLNNLDLTAQEGTVWFDYVNVGVSVGISEQYLNSVDIYPNPVSNELFIKFQNRQDVNINIFNSLGQNVYTSKVQADNNTINTSGLKKGIYFIKIIDENGNVLVSKKILKE